MNEFALRMLIANLEASLSSFHWWQEFFTALVVAGVVCEIVFVVWEYREGLRDFGRGIIHTPEKPSVSLLVFGLFASSLVALGVSGELTEEAKIVGAETKIQRANDELYLLLSKEAGEARSSAEAANKSSGQAQSKANSVSNRTDALTQELTKDEQGISELEAKRAELERSLRNLAVCNAPRVIPFWSIGNTKTSIDPLKPFAGRQAIIEFVPDNEVRRAASNIYGSLDRAGWKIVRISPIDGIDDGVDIQPYVAPTPTSGLSAEWESQWQSEIRSNEAADALVDFLHSYNWQAKRGWPIDEKGQMIRDPKILPPDTLRIRVGLYPAVTYVSPPGAKDFAEAIAQFDQQREASKKQMEKQRADRDEEMLKRLTPQQASDYKAHMEDWKREDEKLMERMSGPCQPLNSLAPSLR